MWGQFECMYNIFIDFWSLFLRLTNINRNVDYTGSIAICIAMLPCLENVCTDGIYPAWPDICIHDLFFY